MFCLAVTCLNLLSTAQTSTFKYSVFFNSFESKLSPNAMATMTNLIDSIRKVDVKAIYITGHTDSIGSVTQNQVLSVERTENVKKFLVKRGTDEAIISTKNFGLSKPIAPNSSAKGRQINRRVDILVEYYDPMEGLEPEGTNQD